MKLLTFLLLSLGLVFTTIAQDVPKLTIEYPKTVQIQSGGELTFPITINVPNGHYVYVRRYKKSKTTLVDFTIENNLFQLLETQRPKGVISGNDYVLRGNAKFNYKLFELAASKLGNLQTALVSTTQLCEDKKGGICYMPETVKHSLSITVEKAKPIKMGSFRSSTGIKWNTSRSEATQKAGSSGQKIFAIITDPDRCGACEYMERESFDKPAVQKVLNEKFVSWKVQRSEYGHLVSGSFGIPTYFILNADGSTVIKKAGGVAESTFLQFLKPYESNGKEDKKDDGKKDEKEEQDSQKDEETNDENNSDQVEKIHKNFKEVFQGKPGFRYQIKNLKINNGGNSASVSPGQTVSVSMDILHFCKNCGDAINQIIVGLSSDNKAQACVWNGKQNSGGEPTFCLGNCGQNKPCDDNPRGAEWKTVKFTLKAPNKKGNFYIRSRYAQACGGCDSSEPLGWWKVDRPNGPDSSSNIGVLTVK
jgi:thioredoxin-related protein